MTSKKKELAVAALRNGTVIDHIPSRSLFRAVHILGIEGMENGVTIGNNLPGSSMGRKGIIKVDGVEFDRDVLNRIAVVAPSATINIIRDYDVAEKHAVELPETLIGTVRCPNPKCITNNEPMRTRFHVIDREEVTIACHYCSHTVKSTDAQII